MEEAAVIMTGLRPERVMEALTLAETQPRGADRTLLLAPDYAVPNVAEKVLRIILSYTDYVRRVVWQEHGAELT
jgi:UDP-N-acetylglucosamine 2-epimerase (non-hydrolysing)